MKKISLTDGRLLVSRLKSGDESAFKVIFDEWFDKIYSFSFRYLKNRALSEEIVQETMIQLWLNREKIDEGLPLAPYIFTICRRLSLNSLRQISTSKNASQKLFLEMREAVNTTEEAIFVAELVRITEEALNLMPKQQQQVYRMSRNQGLSLDEIALELGIMKNTVKKHLSEALRAIRIHYLLKYCLFFISMLSVLKK
jgi:RNA polymerase sigma-70 factor (ECF subfamily)